MNLRQFFTSQTWWGKILGAFLGALIAGPVGALFGILIGNFFDRGLSEHFSRPYWYYHAEKSKNVQDHFFRTMFLALGHIAKADGKVSTAEIQAAKTLMQDMRLNHKQKEQAKHYFKQGKNPDFNLLPYLQKLRIAATNNPKLLHLFVDILYQSALVDGWTNEKLDKMNAILSTLGFAPLHHQYRFYEDYNFTYQHSDKAYSHSKHHSQEERQGSSYTYHPPHQSGLAHAYALLQVSPNDSRNNVKKAYRRLISRHHPDRLIAKGEPEHIIKAANEKTQKIRRAYEQICEHKGWK